MLPLVLLFFSAVALNDASEFEASLLNGDTLRGEILAWETEGIVLKTVQGEQATPTAQLHTLRRNRPPTITDRGADDPAAGLLIEFVDQTRLTAKSFEMSDDRVTLTTIWSPEPLKAPAKQVRRVRLQRLTPSADALWRQLQENNLTGDVLLINKKNGEAADYIVGLVNRIDDSRVTFTWDGETIDVNRTKAAAIWFYRPMERPTADSLTRLVMEDQSEFNATHVHMNGERLAIATAVGLRFDIPLSQVRLIDMSQGKIVYLSDLEPLSAVWTPWIALPQAASHLTRLGEYRRNTSFDGSAITLATKPAESTRRSEISVYRHGLALRSRTELLYDIPPGMSRFNAIAGIDPATSLEGSVALTVYGDQTLLWDGEIAGNAPPVEIAVELAGARRLRILADYGDNLDVGDRLHLVDARLTK